MFENNNVRYILVGDDVTQTSSDYPDSMNVGEIGIFDPAGVRLTNSNVSQNDAFFLALNRGGTPQDIISTPIIDPTNVFSRSSTTSVASSEQVDYIGYDAVNDSGSIDALNDNHYIIDLYVQELLTSSSDGRRMLHAEYESDSSATQEEVALGMAKNLTANFNHHNRPEEYLKAGAVNSGTVATGGASDTFDNDVTATKGSKLVSVATNLLHGGTTITTDHYIRFSEDGSGGTVDSEDHVYKVESVDTTNNTITLDREFRYPTATYNAGGDDHQVIGPNASQTIGSDWGIKIEGMATTYQIGKKPYEKVRFEESLNNFGSTDFNRTSIAEEGQGQFEQVADLEWFLQGNEGDPYREPFHQIYPSRQDAQSSLSYNQHNLQIRRNDTGINFNPVVSPYHVTIFAPDTNPNYFADTNNDSITEVMNVALSGSTGGPLTT